MCGVNGSKFPAIRQHLQKKIGDVYDGLDLSFDSYPQNDECKPDAYLDAIASFQPGDCVTLFTPDDTHFEIALACIKRGLHVLVTKPIVKTLEEHNKLLEAAREAGVLVMVEVHKRYDPIYVDARDRIQELGGLSYMYSYMSQPKHQLQTFKAWAGKSSDISYYLNSHHVDFCEWANLGRAKPISVTASGSWGVAQSQGIETEDTITLSVQWLNKDGTSGHSVHTASWSAPKSDVHSQQRFFYMGTKGEINVDQAHRGYTFSDDAAGFKSVNPLFFKYTPSNGQFSGQASYGYQSFEKFIDAATQINNKTATPSDFDQTLPTVSTTMLTTAILEAGRLSLDKGAMMHMHYTDTLSDIPTKITISRE
jgi:D-galacturonate reductase